MGEVAMLRPRRAAGAPNYRFGDPGRSCGDCDHCSTVDIWCVKHDETIDYDAQCDDWQHNRSCAPLQRRPIPRWLGVPTQE